MYDDGSEYDDGYPRGPFDERAIGEWPEEFFHEPDTVTVRLSADDAGILKELIAERKQRRKKMRQAAMLQLFASFKPEPQQTAEECLLDIARMIEQGKRQVPAAT